MSFPSWLRPFKTAPARKPTRAPRRPAQAARRPQLEALEERCLLSGSPPVVLISGPPQVAESPYGTYALNLAAYDPENDPVSQWNVNWGDGSPVQPLPGTARIATHSYANGPAALNISASAVVGGETFTAHVSGAGAFLGTFAPVSSYQRNLDYLTFGRDITGPGGQPDGVGDLYVVSEDSPNYDGRPSIAVYDGQTGAYARTLLTTGASSYLGDMAFGPDGNLYVSNYNASQVLRYDFTTQTTSTFISGIGTPVGLAFGPDGNLYVANNNSHKIMRYDQVTGQLSTFIDLTSQGVTDLLVIEFHQGYLYVQDSHNSRVLRFDGATGQFHDTFVSPSNGGLTNLQGFAFGPDGDLYIDGAAAIYRYDGATGAFAGIIAYQPARYQSNCDITFGPDTNGDGQADIYTNNETNVVVSYAGPLTQTAATALPVTVLDAVTRSYTSSPKASIPSDLTTNSFSLSVPDAGPVLDVNVTVDITHPNDDDLEVYLVSPAGTRVELFTRVGGTGDNFKVTTLDDEANISITAGTAPFNGPFKPEGLLSAFDGQEAKGTWTLQVRDAVRANKGGVLNSWSVVITRGVGPAPLAAAAAGPGTTAPALSEPQVAPLLAEAVARWQTEGADASALAGVQVRVADLGGTTLGLAAGNTVWLDDDAAGWGWFVDPTPCNDSEFTTPGDQGEQGRMDLLSVVMHEVGHVLGLGHDAAGVMQESLPAGTRRLPTAEEAGQTATVGPVAGPRSIVLGSASAPAASASLTPQAPGAADGAFARLAGQPFDWDAVALSLLLDRQRRAGAGA